MPRRVKLGVLGVLGVGAVLGCREPRPEPSPDAAAQNPTVDSDLFVRARAEPIERLRGFGEGPTWLPGRGLLFTDIGNNRILIHRPEMDSLLVFAEPSGRAAGTSLDARGDLIVCEGNERGNGGRALVRWTLEPPVRTVIADRFEGKRFNSPNDLAIDAQGRIYFSDPHYFEDLDHTVLELDVEGVYRVNADGSELVRVLGADQVSRPNGVELSADERVLYVTDTRIGGPAKLFAFALGPDGLPTGARTVVYDFGSGRGGDGMCKDARGNLYVTAGAHRPPDAALEQPTGLYVFSPTGELIERYPIDDYVATNCTHGGADGRTLYVTGTQFLWTIETKIPGWSRGLASE